LIRYVYGPAIPREYGLAYHLEAFLKIWIPAVNIFKWELPQPIFGCILFYNESVNNNGDLPLDKEKSAPIVVFGGTGHYGRYIVRSLQKNEQIVRVLSRNPVNARKILGSEVIIMEGDIRSERSVKEALNGAKAVIISISAFSRKLIRKLRCIERDSVLRVLGEAQKTDVSRFVYLSVYDIREDVLKKLNLNWEIAEIKKEVENALSQSDMNWTILGGAFSMEMFFAMMRGNTMNVPGGGSNSIPTVSPSDMGEIAAQTVMRTNLERKRIRVTGPEAISFPEAAERISKVTGKTIKFRKISLLPLKIASILSRPITPYFKHLLAAIKLMNNFPKDVVDEVPRDHQWLSDHFDYTPTTLELEARSRF